jgi:large subunit ribosomal protein L10
MPRPEKVKRIEKLTEIFAEAQSIVLNDFTGLNVEKISELRKLCRENDVEYRVVKNTLAKRSVKGTPIEALEAHFDGPTALAVSRESENMSAKILAEFAAEHEAPVFKAAVVEGKIIDATEALTLAKLPSKTELLSKVLGSLKSPGNNLVSVLNGTLRNFLYVVNAVIEKKQSEPEGGDTPQAGESSE